MAGLVGGCRLEIFSILFFGPALLPAGIYVLNDERRSSVGMLSLFMLPDESRIACVL